VIDKWLRNNAETAAVCTIGFRREETHLAGSGECQRLHQESICHRLAPHSGVSPC
jgi:hypothetical protein